MYLYLPLPTHKVNIYLIPDQPGHEVVHSSAGDSMASASHAKARENPTANRRGPVFPIANQKGVTSNSNNNDSDSWQRYKGAAIRDFDLGVAKRGGDNKGHYKLHLKDSINALLIHTSSCRKIIAILLRAIHLGTQRSL
jgi:hypothetical protein